MRPVLKALAAAAILVSANASAGALTTRLHVDNGYIAYLSTSDNETGTQFSSGNNWGFGYVGTASLEAGRDYYLHIYAYDQGGIAGLLGQFSIDDDKHVFANGEQTLFTSAMYWKGNNSGFNGSYGNLADLGTNGVGPWGVQGVSADARWLWAGDANWNDHAYFSTKISAVQPSGAVPEPASLALLGLGLAGLALGRRRQA